MQLRALIERAPPVPFTGDHKLPWHEPGFSARMLAEHLDQRHDRASRRSPVIDAHVAWLHAHVLEGRPSRVLDLCCGPGLYAHRLAALGHRCVGIDVSPAAIGHARRTAREDGLDCEFHLGDVLRTDPGHDFDLALLVSGELNTFPPADVAALLDDLTGYLAPGGKLLLEVHHPAHVESVGRRPRRWWSVPKGLFSARPHIGVEESFWFAEAGVAVERYLIIDAEHATVAPYHATTRAYSGAELADALRAAGFDGLERAPSLTGRDEGDDRGLYVLAAANVSRRSSG